MSRWRSTSIRSSCSRSPRRRAAPITPPPTRNRWRAACTRSSTRWRRARSTRQAAPPATTSGTRASSFPPRSSGCSVSSCARRGCRGRRDQHPDHHPRAAPAPRRAALALARAAGTLARRDGRPARAPAAEARGAAGAAGPLSASAGPCRHDAGHAARRALRRGGLLPFPRRRPPAATTSMRARDVKPPRLDRAKLEVGALLDRLKGDRVGLVVFAGEAFVQCPLTSDYSAARLFLRAVDPGAMPQQGTAIASALLEAKRVLEGGGRGSAAKAVLVITDGEDQQGDALKAAEALGEAGIRIYAVPVGTEEGEPIPLTDKSGNVTGYKKDREGRTVLTRTDVAGLRELSSRGNGLVLRGSGFDLGVLQLLPELDKLQKGDLESRLSVQYDDKYMWFAWPAFLLLCAASALGEGPLWRRRAAQ